ncbi:hypothetical protein PPSIR1_05153 [Plesiocystis pacifica SIR-1]|uniref:Lipoprotein n=1 Tax=Plesiocystis pacifica SIR-1 TaxID=391625 RepID=A6FX03_9BACT|nr:hypothetical protein [Plesiocystis pacifica]EDM81827.1 hypothetical protein PPSIR1_05153 [Plesiocystis pacifica SIR-1]
MATHALWRTRASWTLGLALGSLSSLVVGCFNASSGEECLVGAEGCPCTSAGACDPGLSCLSETCVSDNADGTDMGDEADEAGDTSSSSSGSEDDTTTGTEDTTTTGVEEDTTTTGMEDDTTTTAGMEDDTTTGGSECGNGTIEAPEECDALDLGGASCASLGFASGQLACTADCMLDTSDCSDMQATTTVTLDGYGYDSDAFGIAASCEVPGGDSCAVDGPWPAVENGCSVECPIGADVKVECDCDGSEQFDEYVYQIEVVGGPSYTCPGFLAQTCSQTFTVTENMAIRCEFDWENL